MNDKEPIDVLEELKRGKEAERLLHKLEIGTSHIKGTDEMTCGNSGCQKRVDDMHEDLYKDGGVRDKALKSVCRDDFSACQNQHEKETSDLHRDLVVEAEGFMTKSLFVKCFVGFVSVALIYFVTMGVKITNSADETEVQQIAKDVAVITKIIEKDSETRAEAEESLRLQISAFIAAAQISHDRLMDKIEENYREDAKHHGRTQ